MSAVAGVRALGGAAVEAGDAFHIGSLTNRVSLPTTKYRSADDIDAFYGELLGGLERVPGAVAVGFVNRLGCWIIGSSLTVAAPS